MTRGLFIQAPSLLLNPTLDQQRIDEAIADDAEAGRSEWLGLWRLDLTQAFPDEDIDAAIMTRRTSLPRALNQQYVAFVDPSGGRHDAMTLAIAHREAGERVLLDKLAIHPSPFDPVQVVERLAEALSAYGLSTVTGDRYGGEFVPSAFARHGVRYVAAPIEKNAIYGEVVPLFSARRIELLDIPQLATEFRLLERRPRSGGRSDLIDHPRGARDDAANAVAGALWLASQLHPSDGQAIIGHALTDYDPHDDSRYRCA